MLNIEYGSYQKLYDKYGEDFIYDPDMYFNNQKCLERIV